MVYQKHFFRMQLYQRTSAGKKRPSSPSFSTIAVAILVAAGLVSACTGFHFTMSRSFTVAEDLPFSDQKRIAVNLLDYAHSPSFQLKVRQQFEGLEKKDMEGLQITSNISELIKREDSTANASPDPDQSRRVIIQVVMKTDSSGVSVSDVSTFVVESLQQEEARLVRALRQQKESPESGGTGTDEGLEQDHEAMPPLDDRDDREERGDYRDDVLRESGVI